MKNHKICFFVPFYPIIKGGAEYQARIMADFLLNKGYDVFYISYDKSLTDKISFIDGFKVYSVRVDSSYLENINLYKGLSFKVGRILENEKPDLIYQRVLNTFSYRLSDYAKDKAIPYILHIADNYSVAFEGVKGFVKKLIFKRIIENRAKLVVQTTEQRELILKVARIEIAQIPNIHPFITEKPCLKDGTKILWIGNARPVKQLEVFLKLAENYLGSDFLFHVYGQIPENSYGNSLRETISKLHNVRAYGQRDNDTINRELKNALLLVNTSESEGFSNTFIQSWMSGTPVISLNSNPNNFFSEHMLGKYCNGDFDDMEKGIMEISQNRNYLDLCLNCIEVANNNFGLEKNAHLFLELIENSFHEKD